jgi:hypothetical protein
MKCESCIFYRDIDRYENKGNCHRFPENIITGRFNWCGEYMGPPIVVDEILGPKNWFEKLTYWWEIKKFNREMKKQKG